MAEVVRRDNERFLTLDAMRGIAALMVVTRHFPDQTFMRIFPSTYVAVDMFFVLSGFVLSHAYGWNLAEKMGGPAFLLKRVIRLYPLYLLGTAMSVMVFLAWWATGHPWRSFPVLLTSILGALFLVPLPGKLSYNNAFIYPLNQPAWSLFWELAANLLFAMIDWTVPRLLAVIAGGAILLAFAYYAYGNLDIGWTLDNFIGGAPRVLYSFFIGALLYRFQPKWKWHPPASLLLLVLPLLFMLPKSWDLMAVLLCFPVLVFAGSMTEPGPRWQGLFKFLGDISYPVYVFHYAFLLLAGFACHLAGRELLEAGVMGTVCGVLLSAIAGYYAGTRFDPPARRWLTQAAARLGSKAARA